MVLAWHSSSTQPTASSAARHTRTVHAAVMYIVAATAGERGFLGERGVLLEESSSLLTESCKPKITFKYGRLKTTRSSGISSEEKTLSLPYFVAKEGGRRRR